MLQRTFYQRDTKKVAKELLGKILVREASNGIIKGKIVETEAYYGEEDPASHAYRGKTKRSEIMWGKPGIAYVYFIYGNHYLLNVVTEAEHKPGAVLIRAVEPTVGLELMKQRRNINNVRNLTNGPGKLTQAFGITIKDNGKDLTCGDLWIEEGKVSKLKIDSSKRIGVRRDKKENLRFYIKGNKFISRKDIFLR
jgi:DNA-3-methyladenine glycosylase